MAIHYDAKSKRFRDERGRLVAKDRAMRSSVARREYEAAQRKAKPKPKPAATKPKTKPKAKAKPKAKKVSPAKPQRAEPDSRLPPWEHEGIVREYPEPDEWFPEVDFYDYDDLTDEWGDYDDEDTDS